jgi:hypothetical protein
VRGGITEAPALAGSLQAALQPAERKRAETLLQQELLQRTRAADPAQQQAAASPGR